jgi:hypothetical protein
MKELTAVKDPQTERLDKVNETLAGQLTVQEAIRDNVMEALGKRGGARVKMIATEADIQGVRGTTGVVGQVDDTGVLAQAQRGVASIGNTVLNKLGLVGGEGGTQTTQLSTPSMQDWSKAIEQGMTKAMSTQKAKDTTVNNKVNVRVQTPDGKVNNRTYK